MDLLKHTIAPPRVAALLAAGFGLFSLTACGDDSNPLLTATATLTAGPTSNPNTSNPSSAGDPTGDPTDGTTGDPTDGGTGETDDPTGEPQDGPHALGTIFLGESHPAAGGNSSPAVSASFVPDAGTGAAQGCTESVAGCQLALVPDCGGGCDADEYCGFDDSCEAACLRICDASCGADEVCYFPAPNTPGCKKIESFDAGALTFLGTPIPITLFPPYAFMSDDNASPFAPGGTASVQASGASNAGFAAFEKEFTGTEFIQTSPKLDALGFAEVFGDGPLPVRWNAGDGEVTITATVTSSDFAVGTITCKADDPSGKFDIPRAALEAAVDGDPAVNIAVSVQRQRVDVYKDLTTKGELTGVTVQPVGYLNIITSSTEFHAFQGCNPGEAVCDNTCVDVQYDAANCGGCGKACAGDDACVEGTCNGIEACNACAEESQTGGCKAENDACAANAACKALETCIAGCQTQECLYMCGENVEASTIDLYNAQIQCLCDEVCVGECNGLCS